MRTTLAAAAIVSMALTGAAAAADLPSRSVEPPAPALPIFTWTGFYVGVNAGYHFAESSNVAIATSGALTAVNTATGIVPFGLSPDRDGFTAGGTIGYNFQFAPQFVAGIEADLNYVDGKDTATFIGGTVQPNSYSVNSGFEWFGTVRGRLGFVAGERVMIYATGGLAVADISRSVTHTNGALGVFTTASNSDTEVGWTVGGGVEWAFTNNLTFKAEYLYYAFEDKNTALIYPAPVLGSQSINNFETNGHLARVGVNFKF